MEVLFEKVIEQLEEHNTKDAEYNLVEQVMINNMDSHIKKTNNGLFNLFWYSCLERLRLHLLSTNLFSTCRKLYSLANLFSLVDELSEGFFS